MYRAKIVDNVDPKNLQQVKVRVMGIHSQDELDLPDEVLPWAEPALPLTGGKISDGYGDLEVPEIGDWVWVFFEAHDTKHVFPKYFASIRGNKDTNSNYEQGTSHVTQDRYENITKITKDKYERNDTWNNNTQVTKDYTNYTDHFGNIITLTEDKVEIESKNGNKITLNSSDDKILIRTPNAGSIEIGNNDEIIISINGSKINLDESGEIYITSKDGKNSTIDFTQFMTLFNTHTHNLGYIPTTPPTSPMNIFQHAYQSVSYLGGLPVSNILVTESSDLNAEDLPPGTVFANEKSIHPDSPKVDNENEVVSTLLKNDSTNPSTDEYEGTQNIPTKVPNYTGDVVATVDYYSKGKKTGTGDLVMIQGFALDSNVAKKVYQMIKDSQIYNMVENLQYLEFTGGQYNSNSIFTVTEKGAEVLTKDDGTFYAKDEPFKFTEEYQNKECVFSLIQINSGFRGHYENIIKDGQILCYSQLYLRKLNQKAKYTETELKTLPSTKFAPYTATPGWSKHQNGKAVDFNTRGAGQWEWLKKFAGDYGFERTVKSERWHHEYTGD